MEMVFLLRKIHGDSDFETGFNPCFDGNGLLAFRHPAYDWCCIPVGFNPCFDGNGLLALRQSLYSETPSMFQSLF